MLLTLRHRTWTMIFICLLFLLPGCWSGHELTDQLIVLGISLDKVEGKFRLTLQGIRPEASTSASSKSTQSGGDPQPTFSLLTADGDSVQEALQKIDQITPRFLYGGHNQVYFIGEELAKSGIMPYLDLFARNPWSQESAWIIIAKGGTGQKLLTTTNLLVKYPSMGLTEMVRKHQIQIPTLYQFLLQYHGESGSQILVSAFDFKNKTAPPGFQIDQLFLQPSAIFQGDKLKGYLNDLDGQAYDWLEYGFHSTRFSFPLSPDPDAPPPGVILSGSPGIFHILTYPELGVRLEMNFDFYVSEYAKGQLSSPAEIRALENKLNDVLSQRFEQLFTHLKEDKADVFDLAEKVHAYYPQLWQKVQDRWPDVYAELPVEITVNSHFRNSSVMLKYPGLKE